MNYRREAFLYNLVVLFIILKIDFYKSPLENRNAKRSRYGINKAYDSFPILKEIVNVYHLREFSNSLLGLFRKNLK